MRYMVVTEGVEDSFRAYVTDLSGCVAIGETEGEVNKIIREAIDLHFEELQDPDPDTPKPESKSEYAEAAGA